MPPAITSPEKYGQPKPITLPSGDTYYQLNSVDLTQLTRVPGQSVPANLTPRGFVYSLGFRTSDKCLLEGVGPDMT